MPITCAECRGFTRDTIGDGNGIGSCNTMESWLDKFPRRRPKPAIYDENYKKLGAKAYWPNVQRVCEKFKAVTALDVPLSQARSREY